MRISDWSSDVCSSDLLSEWSPKPDAEYTVPFYARQAVELLDQLKLQSVRWVGTSMGGLVGMVAAATALTGRISHLVLNDVGPAIAPTAVQRILQYAGNPPVFATVPEAERYFRSEDGPVGKECGSTCESRGGPYH